MAYDKQAGSRLSAYHSQAKMIISLFEVEKYQLYFTLTFTHSESAPGPYRR